MTEVATRLQKAAVTAARSEARPVAVQRAENVRKSTGGSPL